METTVLEATRMRLEVQEDQAIGEVEAEEVLLRTAVQMQEKMALRLVPAVEARQQLIPPQEAQEE
jgi:hypothetical protein